MRHYILEAGEDAEALKKRLNAEDNGASQYVAKRFTKTITPDKTIIDKWIVAPKLYDWDAAIEELRCASGTYGKSPGCLEGMGEYMAAISHKSIKDIAAMHGIELEDGDMVEIALVGNYGEEK